MHFHKLMIAALLTSGLAGTAYAADSMAPAPAKPAMTNGMAGPMHGMSGPMKKKKKKKTGTMTAPMTNGMAGPAKPATGGMSGPASGGMAGPKAH